MASFDEEHYKTSEKRSDLVMEYVSQFIAHDYLEIYEKASNEQQGKMVPLENDEKIYKKVSDQVKKKTGYRGRIFRRTVLSAIIAFSVLSIAFTVYVLTNDTLRHAVFNSIAH